MPKVLQINVTANWGSTGKIAEQIGTLAEEAGWVSYMAYGRTCNPSRLRTFRAGSDLEVKVHYLINRFFDSEGLGSRCATRKLIRMIDEIKPDIIHLHNIHGHYLNYPMLVRHINKRGIPVVWTLHDAWIITGHCYLFGGTDCEKWKKECHNCPMAIKYGLDRSRQNFRRKKHLFTSLKQVELVTVSNWLENVIGESFMKDYPRRTIYNGIDLNVFQPRESDWKQRLGFDHHHIILGVATAWDERKGFQDYMKLSAILPPSYIIVLVGLTDDMIAHLPQNVVGMGKTKSQEDLAALYSIADVVTSLSVSESMGMTPVEGMACGTPAIVYDNTAQPELVTPETGMTVTTGDVAAVKEAIIKICTKGKSHYSEACRERAVTLYNKNKNYFQYVNLYCGLLQR